MGWTSLDQEEKPNNTALWRKKHFTFLSLRDSKFNVNIFKVESVYSRESSWVFDCPRIDVNSYRSHLQSESVVTHDLTLWLLLRNERKLSRFEYIYFHNKYKAGIHCFKCSKQYNVIICFHWPVTEPLPPVNCVLSVFVRRWVRKVNIDVNQFEMASCSGG